MEVERERPRREVEWAAKLENGDARRDQLGDIPSAAVAHDAHRTEFRNRDKGWTGNDLRDGDVMCTAIPYCDVVLTDKFVAAQLKKSPAATKPGTLVLSRLRDLNDALPGLIADRHVEAEATPNATGDASRVTHGPAV